MAATLRAAGTVAVSSGVTSRSVTLPTGWQPGDLHILLAANGGNANAFNALAGWTQIADQAVTLGGTAGDTRLTAWFRIAQAGDGNPSVTVGTATSIVAQILGFSGGFSPSMTDFAAEAFSQHNNWAGDITPTGPSVTTPEANELVIVACAMDARGAAGATTMNPAATASSGETVTARGQGQDTTDRTLLSTATYVKTTAGASTVDWTHSDAASTQTAVFGAFVIPNALTAVAGSDSGTATDAGSASVTASGSESGTGSEAGSASVTASGSDSAAGAETNALTVIPSAGSDSATATDTGTVSVTAGGVDTGSGSDTGSVSATVAGSDSGTGTDTQTSIASPVAGSDSATGTDTGSVSTAAAGSDSAAGTEAGAAAVSAAGADSATATDAGSVADITGGATPVSGADSASTVEAGEVLDLTPPPPVDDGEADEGAIYGYPPDVRRGADAAVARETSRVVRWLPTAPRRGADAAVAREAGALVVALRAADGGVVREASTIQVFADGGDGGAARELVAVAVDVGEEEALERRLLAEFGLSDL